MPKFILVNPKTNRNVFRGGRTFEKRQNAKNVKKKLLSQHRDALSGQQSAAKRLREKGEIRRSNMVLKFIEKRKKQRERDRKLIVRVKR